MGADCPAMFSIGDTYKHVKLLFRPHPLVGEKNIISNHNNMSGTRQPSRLNVVKA